MAVSSLYSFDPSLHSHSKIPSQRSSSNPGKIRDILIDGKQRRCRVSRLVVFSTHSNAKILKFNKKSRFGRTLSPCVSAEDDDEVEDGDDDYDDGIADKHGLLIDDFAEPAEFKVDRKRSKQQKKINERQVDQRQSIVRSGWDNQEKGVVGKFYHTKGKAEEEGSSQRHIKRMVTPKISSENRYEKLFEEIDLDKKWQPLIDY